MNVDEEDVIRKDKELFPQCAYSVSVFCFS